MFRELNMTLGLSKMSTDQLADEYYQVELKPTDCLNFILGFSFQLIFLNSNKTLSYLIV